MSMVIEVDANSIDAVKELLDDAAKEVVESWDVIKADFLEAAEKINEQVCPAMEIMAAWYETMQRDELLDRLERRRIPNRMAATIAAHWPRAWLPEPSSQ